jgi:hypothetical protein
VLGDHPCPVEMHVCSCGAFLCDNKAPNIHLSLYLGITTSSNKNRKNIQVFVLFVLLIQVDFVTKNSMLLNSLGEF